MGGHKGVVGVLVFLAGCATVPANAPAYRRAPDAAQGRANVYVYGGKIDGRDPCARLLTGTLFVDGRPAFDLLEGAYTVLSLAEGRHRLQVSKGGCPELEFYLQVEESRSRYIRFGDSSFPADVNGRPGWRQETRAEEIAESIAETELRACCRYVVADPLPDHPSPGDTLVRGHR